MTPRSIIEVTSSVLPPGDTNVEISEGDRGTVSDDGVVTSRDDDLEAFTEAFVDAIRSHRHWERDPKEVPA